MRRYFDPDDYEVIGFYENTVHSSHDAAEILGIPPYERSKRRGDPPYETLRTGRPQIWAAEGSRVWVTLDVRAHHDHGHDVDRYRQEEGHSRDTPAILLWRKDQVPVDLDSGRERARRLQAEHDAEVARRQQEFRRDKRAAADAERRSVLSTVLSDEPLIDHLRRLQGLVIDGPDDTLWEVTAISDNEVTLVGEDGRQHTVTSNEVEAVALSAVDGLPVLDPGVAPVAALVGTLDGAEYNDELVIRRSEIRSALPAGELDRIVTTRVRVEQQTARRLLFGGAGLARCALCGDRLPTDLLVAAHIKPRSQTDTYERRDLSNIVMAACVFGCDAVYERGLVGVGNDGMIVASAESAGATAPPALASHVQRLVGRQCRAHSDRSASYFQWHWDHVLRD